MYVEMKIAQFFVVICLFGTIAQHTHKTVQVILFGAYGNLATKYLWQALFDIHENLLPWSIEVVGAATSSTGLTKIQSIIASNVTCSRELRNQSCSDRKNEFLSSIKYISNRNLDGYTQLVSEISRTDSANIHSRVFYLSVSPHLMAPILKQLTSAMPLKNSVVPTRILLEKPIGWSASSATSTLATIKQYVDESDIYIMDHYLGKVGVAMVVEFGGALAKADGGWKDLPSAVSEISVAMIEDETLKGRTAYFNDYGIVRDVMQNHLTLVALAATAAGAGDWTNAARLRKINAITWPAEAANIDARTASRGSSNILNAELGGLDGGDLFGVYKEYPAEVTAENGGRSVQPHPKTLLSTIRNAYAGATKPSDAFNGTFLAPTAAKVLLHVDGKPVTMMCGKAMGVRSVQVELKIARRESVEACGGDVSITLLLQGKLLNPSLQLLLPYLQSGPAVILSGLCPTEVVAAQQQVFNASLWSMPLTVLPHSADGVVVAIPRLSKDRKQSKSAHDDPTADLLANKHPEAYHNILSAAIVGDKSFFVSPEEVEALWSVWDAVAQYGDLVTNFRLNNYVEYEVNDIYSMKFMGKTTNTSVAMP